jgi:hypothetical protein
MPGDIGSLQVEDLKLKNLRSQTQTRHRSELREIEERNQSELARTMESFEEANSKLKEAYEVQISQEGAQLEERLANVRERNEARINSEKNQGDQEVAKIKTANQERISEYQKAGDAQIEKLKQRLQAQTEALHEKEKQEARKQGLSKKGVSG